MRKTLLLTLIVVLVAAALLWWANRPVDVGQETVELHTGLWQRGQPLEGDPDELARLLSLPYAAGGRPATIPGLGVVTWDRERAQLGLNLYVSGHASEALMIDMEGTLVHRWRAGLTEITGQRGNTIDNTYMRRVQLLANGDLIALWQNHGVARIDLRSRPVWARDLGAYNDLYYGRVDGAETLIIIHKEAESRPELRAGPVLNDFLVWLDPSTGESLRRISLLDTLLASPWASALDQRFDLPDILHANTVTVLTESMVEGSPFRSGQVLFSLRDLSLLGVLDPDTEELVWALQGPPFEVQHEPVLLPGGTILLFDNLGAGEWKSRALEIDLKGEVVRQFPEDDSWKLYSSKMGAVQRLANGNTLIVETEGGSAIEVAPDGAIVWRFETPHRSGERGELIAMLPELVRVPVPEWAQGEGDWATGEDQ